MCDKAAQIELRSINHCLTKRAVIRGLLVRIMWGRSLSKWQLIVLPATVPYALVRSAACPGKGAFADGRPHGKIEAYIPSKNDRPFAECTAYW